MTNALFGIDPKRSSEDQSGDTLNYDILEKYQGTYDLSFFGLQDK